eukprot:Skav210334  [mRNA]  locus=scaffold4443:49401:56848:- [translate_table: standard]
MEHLSHLYRNFYEIPLDGVHVHTLPSWALAPYQGPKPPWNYEGFNSFPAFYFGANESGLENASWLPFVARHQVAGWGWQQNFRSVSLAQMASRMATYIEVTPASPQKRLQAVGETECDVVR